MKTKTKTKIQHLMFPDGSSLQAANAKALLDAWRTKQWHGPDDNLFRDELTKRAYVWSGTFIDPTLPAAAFLKELQRAGLVKIIILEGGK